jgi:hypothetical protein
VKRSASANDWLPLAKRSEGGAELPTGEAFRSEWIDFGRGIRVGNIEPHERITRILKFHLEQRYRTPFVTDRWGRGVYWRWICWLPRANRQAKPISHDVNFGCAKLFITTDSDTRIFRSGLAVERGYVTGPEANAAWGLRSDWDWHRFTKQCDAGTEMDKELNRLLRSEGFAAAVLGNEVEIQFSSKNFRSAKQIKEAMKEFSRDHWAGFQLYYPMPEHEVRACSGYELVKAICGVFAEVTPAMNACMQVPLIG